MACTGSVQCVVLLLFVAFRAWRPIGSRHLAFAGFNGVEPPQLVGLDNFQRPWRDDDRSQRALRGPTGASRWFQPSQPRD